MTQASEAHALTHADQRPKNILRQTMADEFNFLWLEDQNYSAKADADLIPVPGPGQLDLHGRCRYGVLLSPCFGASHLSQIQLWGWRNYPPPSKKLFTQNNSCGIIFGVIATLSRNQLRKRIL